MINLNRQTLLAKLLAKENIQVVQGNYQTASFNVETRVLKLPLWDDHGKDVFDLLVGHEVGHALYTPTGIEKIIQRKNLEHVPFSYFNIVEDIRIERNIQEKYPGLILSFQKGYQVFFERDMFQIKGRDLIQFPLIDRINIKAKLGNRVDVRFSSEELPYVKLAFEASSFDEVIDAATKIYEFSLSEFENQESQQTQEKNRDSKEVENSEDAGSVKKSTPGPKESLNKEQSQDPDSRDLKEEPETASGLNHNPDSKENSGSPVPDPRDSNTYDALEKNKEDLIYKDPTEKATPKILNTFSKEQIKNSIVTIPTLINERKRVVLSEGPAKKINLEKSYVKFMKNNKNIINLMVKEFERRKSADRHKRAQTARKGSLDVNALHKYKYDDQIFKSVTTLADSKSHGMVMFVDFSASMSSSIGSVINQTLILTEFCKRVKIPFDVYAFTSSKSIGHQKMVSDLLDQDTSLGNRIHSNFSLFHWLSSNQKRAKYKEAHKSLFFKKWIIKNDRYHDEIKFERMLSTPLKETILAADFLLDEFKAKNNLQNVVAVFLTDGQGDRLKYTIDPESNLKKNNSGRLIINTKRGPIKGNVGVDIQIKLFNHLRSRYTVLGYFINCRSVKEHQILGDFYQSQYTKIDSGSLTRLSSELKDQGFVSVDNEFGYDRLFIFLSSGALKTDTTKFKSKSVQHNDFQEAFGEYAATKKQSRVLSAKFAEIIS